MTIRTLVTISGAAMRRLLQPKKSPAHGLGFSVDA
jgi:hypothetical protein